jgi:hypothetical protein
MRGFANIFGDYNDCLHQHFGRRGFAIIFSHYNGSRAFVDTFVINIYDDLPSSLSLRGYINFFGTDVYFTFLNHLGSRGSPITSVLTYTFATMATMTTSTTTCTTKDSVTSAARRS